jgi:uncharacterized protein
MRYDAAALFHDVNDAIYASAAGHVPLLDFFSLHAVPPEVADLVHKIVENVSYSKERRRMQNGEQTEWHATCLELHWLVRPSQRLALMTRRSVQDADKLDAMGAIGTMRCAAYSCGTVSAFASNNPPQDETEPATRDPLRVRQCHPALSRQAVASEGLGRRLGERRHAFMEQFLQQVDEELDVV